MKDLFNLTTLSGPSGWQEKEAKDLSDIVQRRLHHLQVIHLVVKTKVKVVHLIWDVVKVVSFLLHVLKVKVAKLINVVKVNIVNVLKVKVINLVM